MMNSDNAPDLHRTPGTLHWRHTDMNEFTPRRFALVLLSVWCATYSVWAPAEEITWKVGDEMRQALQLPVGVRRSARPIRDGIQTLSASQRVACWLDRRVDPNQELELFVDSSPLQAIFQHMAQKLRASVGYVGPVVYIGPSEVAGKLWTVAELRSEEVERFPTDLRSKWTRAAPVHWEPLSTPRELLTAAASDGGCMVAGLEAIPHDLWPAADLPPLNIVERLTLILAGFDRTFSVDPTQRLIRLVPLPDKPQLERQYTPRGEPSRALAELSGNFPGANFKRSGTKLIVTGSAEDHDDIRRLLRGEKIRRGPIKQVEVRYKLEVKNQLLGAVLREVEKQANLQVTIDEAATAKLRDRVSFEVSEATLEQLLEAALKGTGLTFQLNGTELRISLAKE
jgi:hypothetical protein